MIQYLSLIQVSLILVSFGYSWFKGVKFNHYHCFIPFFGIWACLKYIFALWETDDIPKEKRAKPSKTEKKLNNSKETLIKLVQKFIGPSIRYGLELQRIYDMPDVSSLVEYLVSQHQHFIEKDNQTGTLLYKNILEFHANRSNSKVHELFLSMIETLEVFANMDPEMVRGTRDEIDDLLKEYLDTLETIATCDRETARKAKEEKVQKYQTYMKPKLATMKSTLQSIRDDYGKEAK